jgi:hypothetical protein
VLEPESADVTPRDHDGRDAQRDRGSKRQGRRGGGESPGLQTLRAEGRGYRRVVHLDPWPRAGAEPLVSNWPRENVLASIKKPKPSYIYERSFVWQFS